MDIPLPTPSRKNDIWKNMKNYKFGTLIQWIMFNLCILVNFIFKLRFSFLYFISLLLLHKINESNITWTVLWAVNYVKIILKNSHYFNLLGIFWNCQWFHQHVIHNQKTDKTVYILILKCLKKTPRTNRRLFLTTPMKKRPTDLGRTETREPPEWQSRPVSHLVIIE